MTFRRCGRRLASLALGVLLCVGGSGPVAGAEAVTSLDQVVNRVEETCAQARDLTAHFRQTATNRALGQVQEASGRFLMKRPGKMRWEYQKPEPRLFVTDGKTMWVYSPRDKQVIVQELGAALPSRIPLAFLAGDCDLRREFRIGEVRNAATRAAASSMILDLTPRRPEGGIARILLEVSLQSYTVERVTLFDAYGNTTVIALTDLTLNPDLPDSEFEFTPPPGVTVVSPPR